MGKEEDANAARREAARIQAIQDLAALGPAILDRYGRPILPGGLIEFHHTLPISFLVVDAKPDLGKNAEPGDWILTLEASMQVRAKHRASNPRMTVVMLPPPPAEAEAAPPAAPGDTAAASDAPATPPSSIILTDLDKTARETLDETPLRKGLALVAPTPVVDSQGEGD